MEILNEVYFGKGPIAPMQAQFSRLRAKLKNKPVTSSTNLDPEILKFNRIVEKTFGFSNFALYIQPDHMPNAYTFGVETFYSDEEKEKLRRSIIANPTGFKFDTKHMQVSTIMAINSGLLDLERVSDEEIVAIMLHEVIHSFFEAVCLVEPSSNKLKNLSNLILSINSLIIEKISNGKNISLEIINNDFSKLSKLINRTKESVKTRLFRKRGTISEAMSDNLSRKMLQYTNEKFADTGVAMYGYAEELHHALLHLYDDYYEEMNKKKKYPRIYEIYKMWDYYLTDGLLYLLGLQDEHPTELTRVSTAIQYIKRELAKEGIDPKMKKELMSQLQNCQTMIDSYLNVPRDEDSMRIARLYYKKLWEKFGGDRRERDADNDAFFKHIDDRYYELLKK